MILDTDQNNCCNCRHYGYDEYNSNVFCSLLINMVYNKIVPAEELQELTEIKDIEGLREINMLTMGSLEALANIPDPYHHVCSNWR